MTIDLIGSEICNYQVVKLIGEGGMATVWRGEHPMLGKTVAIKVLDPLLARDQKLVQRFLDEARIQIDLKHPNIVATENFSDDPLAMVMEFVEGSSLDERIGRRAGPVPVQKALPLMMKIMEAVGHAHQHGVIHRDIKPANILVTPDGTVKVTDFGIAKILGGHGLTQTGAAMGTAAYMSPEQIKGAKNVDARSDIYSLGITFYEMLVGQTPFEGDPDTESDFELRRAQVSHPPPDPRSLCPAIPDAVAEVVLKALEKDPAQRPQTVEELSVTLVTAAGGTPIVGNGTSAGIPQPADSVRPPTVPHLAPTVIETESKKIPPTLFSAGSHPAPSTTNAGEGSRFPMIAVGVIGGILAISLVVGLLMLFLGSDDELPSGESSTEPAGLALHAENRDRAEKVLPSEGNHRAEQAHREVVSDGHEPSEEEGTSRQVWERCCFDHYQENIAWLPREWLDSRTGRLRTSSHPSLKARCHRYSAGWIPADGSADQWECGGAPPQSSRDRLRPTKGNGTSRHTWERCCYEHYQVNIAWLPREWIDRRTGRLRTSSHPFLKTRCHRYPAGWTPTDDSVDRWECGSAPPP